MGPCQARARTSAFLDVHLRTKGAVARWAANACLLDSPRRLLCRLRLPVSRGSLMAGTLDFSLSVCVCLSPGLLQSLSLSLDDDDDETDRRQIPWPLHPPALAPACGLQQKQR